jgi:DNA-binding response OmpR family regulator
MARILVIDDDNTLRWMMAMTLETAGHTVMQAATGNEGIMLFNAHPADLVITDLVLPEHGIGPILDLRQQHPDTPFIIVSGLSRHTPNTLEIAKVLHARRTLAKPFRLAEFLGAIQQVLAEQNVAKS